MPSSSSGIGETPPHRRVNNNGEADRASLSASAVSWGAVAAGAAAAAALSLILLILGVGLGLSSVSPWAHAGAGATAMGVSTIVWLTFTQLLASGMGGYLAGRLRTRWTEVHADEVYFRDTAHGFLAWAVSSLATAALLTSVIGSIVGSGVQAGASMASGVASAAGAATSACMASEGEGGSMAYFVDSLFRSTEATPAATPESTPSTTASVPSGPSMAGGDASNRIDEREAMEIARIFMNLSLSEPLPAEDVRHVGQMVAQRTGLSQAEAEKRVTDTYARAQAEVQQAETAAREAADTARKASAYAALWLFVSLLVGAFFASLAATFGGRQRDA
jgi:hypothetical protein